MDPGIIYSARPTEYRRNSIDRAFVIRACKLLALLMFLTVFVLRTALSADAAGYPIAAPEPSAAGYPVTAVEPSVAGYPITALSTDAVGYPITALEPTAAGYKAPGMRVSSFHRDQAVGGNGVLIDFSGAEEGYIGVSGQSQGRLKFQVIKDGETYTYDLKSDGTPSIFPLQLEDGMYSFRALENVSGSKYAVLYQTDETITIDDSFVPFLCASDYVNYTEQSACVKKAQELAAGAADVNGVISAVYDYVCKTVTYDKVKAKTVQSGYLPDPDETLATGKGICFDYASLTAAMLRSQGIPCKVIFGYVSPNELYHAWNMFYTEEKGWVTVKFEISPKNWNRMDLTFTANGADGTFVGDGSNYKDVYCY